MMQKKVLNTVVLLVRLPVKVQSILRTGYLITQSTKISLHLLALAALTSPRTYFIDNEATNGGGPLP